MQSIVPVGPFSGSGIKAVCNGAWACYSHHPPLCLSVNVSGQIGGGALGELIKHIYARHGAARDKLIGAAGDAPLPGKTKAGGRWVWIGVELAVRAWQETEGLGLTEASSTCTPYPASGNPVALGFFV